MNPIWPAYFSGGLVQPPTNFHAELNLDFERLVIHFKTRWGWHSQDVVFRLWCQPWPRISPNSDLEQKGISEHSAFCFFPKKNDTWWLSLAKVDIEPFWIRSGSSSLTPIRVEKSRCGSWSLPWWDIRHRSAGFSASRNIFCPWVQQINYHKISVGSELFFWAHTTSSHLDVQSDFIQDTGCASSMNKWHEDLFFCSSTINLLWDDQWWIAVAGDEPPQSKPWNRKVIEISIKRTSWILSRIIRPPCWLLLWYCFFPHLSGIGASMCTASICYFVDSPNLTNDPFTIFFDGIHKERQGFSVGLLDCWSTSCLEVGMMYNYQSSLGRILWGFLLDPTRSAESHPAAIVFVVISPALISDVGFPGCTWRVRDSYFPNFSKTRGVTCGFIITFFLFRLPASCWLRVSDMRCSGGHHGLDLSSQGDPEIGVEVVGKLRSRKLIRP